MANIDTAERTATWGRIEFVDFVDGKIGLSFKRRDPDVSHADAIFDLDEAREAWAW